MKIKGLDHIVFAVRDVEQAAAAWKHVFGLEVGQRLQPESIQALIGLMQVGVSGSMGALLELAQPLGIEGPVAQALEERGEGMLSLSIEVKDIDVVVAELHAAGVAISDVVQGPLPATRVARMPAEPTHGVRLQLIERVG
ncbi:MAG: VOC family protein [Chloroflexi bacterium]|nr:VOC family protein [Chloroflexota bacterium]